MSRSSLVRMSCVMVTAFLVAGSGVFASELAETPTRLEGNREANPERQDTLSPAETCQLKVSLETVLSPETAISTEPAPEPAIGTEDPEFLMPTHPCFRPPLPPAYCTCGGCCENCRCWHSGNIAKCVDTTL